MKTRPTISIIIPVYNVAEYIGECLQSVMRQTYQGEIECIIVDDCGTDNSIAVAERLIAEYKGPIAFRVLHHENNRGLSAARNTGTDAATGDYIYYLDSDDYISDDCIEKLYEPMKNKDYDMVIGDYETFGDYIVQSLLFEQKEEIIGNENIFHELAEKQIPVIACNKMYNLNFLKRNNIDFVEGQLHEDDLWTYKICLVASQIAIQKRVTYYYRQHATSIVYSDNIKLQQRFLSVMETAEYILQHKPSIINMDYYRCSMTYIGKGLSYAIDGDFDFYNEYKRLRERVDYNPLNFFFRRRITLLELKRSIHLALPIFMGYWYLLLRRTKNKNRQ